MKKNSYIDIFSTENIRNVTEDRKLKKFFRWAIPVLVLEVIVIAVMTVLYFMVPKNYCVVSVNMKEAVVYMNNKTTQKARLDNPKEKIKYFYYEIDLMLELPGDDDYSVTFDVGCDKYRVFIATTATKQDEKYTMIVTGGEKTQLLSGVTLVSNELIKNFEVKVTVNVEKI